MPTRNLCSIIGVGSILAVVLLLAACTPGGQFDPTEALSTDLFNTKKKIPGEREPLFPNGVPGAETGVPPDLVKGYQPPPEQAADADAAKPPVEPAKPKPKPKPKPKVARAQPPATPAHDRAFAQKPVGAAAPMPAPGPAAWPNPPAAPTAQTHWPTPGGQSQPAAPPSAQAAWPAPSTQVQPNWPNPATGKPQ